MAALLVWDSGVIQKNMTAVTIGDRKYTAVDVDYYYYSSYSTYANYASTYGLDTSKPLDEQEVIETAARVKGTFRALLDETIRRIGEE